MKFIFFFCKIPPILLIFFNDCTNILKIKNLHSFCHFQQKIKMTGAQKIKTLNNSKSEGKRFSEVKKRCERQKKCLFRKISEAS